MPENSKISSPEQLNTYIRAARPGAWIVLASALVFLLGLFIAAPFVGVRVDTSLSNTLVRFGMNGVMVLAMIPMVQAGCGLNFGLASSRAAQERMRRFAGRL